MAPGHTAVRRVVQQDTALLRATCLAAVIAAPSRVQINHRLGPWPLPASVFLVASRSLARNQSSSITGFLALGLGVLLLSLIPQFQYSLENEIGTNHPQSKLPKLFLFNIQERDVDSLLETLASENKPLQNLTPWVRGKLLKVKGENYEKYVRKDKESASSDDKDRNRFSRLRKRARCRATMAPGVSSAYSAG